MSKTIALRGIIQSERWVVDGFDRIYLVQDNGYKIDLVGRIHEAIANYGSKGEVRYWISSIPMEPHELNEEYMKVASGAVSANYEHSSGYYSEWTPFEEWDTILRVGRHNLLVELDSQEGKFVWLELTLHN